jgi:regulator of vacuolar morphogenesis
LKLHFRSEANSLPILFTAPQPAAPQIETVRPQDDNGVDNLNPHEESPVREGVYVDGVYVAPQNATISTTDVLEATYSDAQASYYNLLHHRFLLLRSILKCTPPPEAITALDDLHPISFPRHSKTARKEWRHLLLAVDPSTVQLACMDMDSVLGVLGIMARLISENVRSGSAERVRRMGAWAWGLLGKCRDVGQLGTEEVGEIRDLGKRAAKILCKMKEEELSKNQAAAQDGETSDDESDFGNGPVEGDDGVPKRDLDMPDAENNSAEGDELEQAKARLQAKLQGGEDQAPLPADEPPVEAATTECELVDVATQTKAMLDMIITVVGQYYGQRDLLQARELWEVSPEE